MTIIIDFDITNDAVRDRPIIIVEDINTHQSHVLLGKEGQSHGMFVSLDLDNMCEKENIIMDMNKIGYGYLLGPIAFVDETPDGLQIGYTNEEVINILKADPRIKKIISQDIEKANDFMRDNVTDTEFYILFKEKNPDTIAKRLRTLMLGLSNAGLDSVQTSNTDLRVILESFLNAGMTTENKVVLPK